VQRQQSGSYTRAVKGTAGFYADIPAFSDFVSFTDPQHYSAAPADWLVVIADIAGSTAAIEAGRYKDVNMVGAACITAVLNAIDGVDIPFVFGGDGATLLVPPQSEAPVRAALSGLQRLSQNAFRLALRVGFVPVAEITERGRAVRVARFGLSAENSLAFFSGGGIELAESLIKGAADDGRYCMAASDAAGDPDLSGLSCRWEPLKSRNGIMLAVLVQALDRAPDSAGERYRTVAARVTEIVGGTPDAGNPVSEATLRFRWPPRGLALEARTAAISEPLWRARLRVLKESFFQWIANRYDLTIGPLNAKRYRTELSLNADYRRFDDTLRLVVDATETQATDIAAFLDEQRAAGRCAYGIHRSNEALMTCLVFSLEASDHLHFIDGANGGFALAARQLKAQLAAERS
jgi:Protein of unknown function (DUF3095)